jgi:lysophospholipase L1-like esterase
MRSTKVTIESMRNAATETGTTRRSRAPGPLRLRTALGAACCAAALLLAVACTKTDSPFAALTPRVIAAPAKDPTTTERQDRVPTRRVDDRIAAAFTPPLPSPRQKPAEPKAERFLPVLVGILKPETFTPPGSIGEEPPAELRAPDRDNPLGRFYAKLAALEAGSRSEPVTILHIGDSHVAADSFTRGIRSRLQDRFGDAGRGMVVPAGVFRQTTAAQVDMSQRGSWSAASSLKEKTGPYGLSGVRLSASSPDAVITLTAQSGAFDWAEVTVAGGSGSFEISVDGRASRHSAAGGEAATTVRVAQKGKVLKIRPAGNGRVTVLNWATGKERPGIRYVNFGIVGATVDVTRRWSPDIVANDLAALKPDLIVYGYGTNEGFNDNLDPKAYKAYAEKFVGSLRSAAPQADLLFIGAADGARKGRGKGCGGAWATPAKLDSVRGAVRDVATDVGGGYWSWAEAMGGRCAIDRWASDGLAAKDRVHLTSAGYDRSADAFVDFLVAPLDKPTPVAMTR